MRGQLATVLRRQIHNFQERGDPADARGVRLDKVAGVAEDQLLVFAEAGQHLAGGNRCIQRGGELRVAFNVVSVKGFFNPDQVERLHFAPHADSGFAIPLLIGVDH